MTKDDLLNALSAVPDDARILIDIKRWDEPLNLTPVMAVRAYPAVKGGAVSDEEFFVTLTPSTEGATRLDPNGEA